MATLLAAALLATGCRGAELPDCAAAAPIEVDLDQWVHTHDELATATERTSAAKSLLASLGVEPLPDPGGESMQLSRFQISPVRRGDGETLDWLVAALFRDQGGAESLRAQLLLSQPGHDHIYCPAGDDLSRDKASFEEPCLEPHDGPARSLTLEPLIAPDRDAIVVRDAGGWCGSGADRGDRLATSFWGIEEGRLVRYFEAVTFEAWYQSPAPPAKTRQVEIEQSETWPREITLTETVECLPPDDPAADTDCEPFVEARRLHYVDNHYTAIEESSPSTAGSAGIETEESSP